MNRRQLPRFAGGTPVTVTHSGTPPPSGTGLSAPPASLAHALQDRYHLERELGRGGMATVFLARDLKHQRLVALKVLHPELAQALGPGRFLREIRLTAQLQHPHILPVFDSGQVPTPAGDGGPLYYTMPYVRGESLRQRLERERQLPLDDALRIARQVLAALGYAHAQGIVHRDIKPENILLHEHPSHDPSAPDGYQAMVADFGIARASSTAEGEKLTATGLTLGTPAYMSPEQAVGDDHLDGRSDLYSLGCVMYEMLGGEPPFTGRTPQMILAKRLSEPVPHLRTIRDVPEAIERAVTRALARSAADRFATAAQFAAELEAPVTERSVPPRQVGRSAWRGSRRWLVLGALAGLVALGVELSRWPRSPAPALDPNLVAVAPFDVLDPTLALWRDGLMDVLSRTLDGLGPLRTVSPTIVSRQWSGRPDPVSAQDLGRRTGAGLAVFGQLVALGGDSARLSATLLDVTSGARRSEFERVDRVERLSALADSISLAFVRDLGLSGRGRLHPGSVGTRSLVALKAFLQGERHFREGALDSAIASFERAVDLDSTFTLALRRLASAHDWKDGPDAGLGRLINLQAGRFNHGLSPRDSLLVVADSLQAASDDTLLDSIARSSLVKRRFQTLRTATRTYPGDPEVWYQLGEARAHYGSEVGATVSSVLNAFDRSIALDSTFAVAYAHPILETLYLGDCERALRYLRKAVSLHVPGLTDAPVTALLIQRMLHGSADWHAEIQPALDTLSNQAFKDLADKVRNCPDTGETNIWLVRQLAAGRPGRGELENPAEASTALALSLMNRGHLRQSYRVLRQRPIADFLSRSSFAELALLGGVSRDTAAAVFRRWLNGPDLGFMAMALPWWAAQRDTASIRAMIDRGVAAARAADKEHRNTDSEGARIARVYLALARADTAEVWRRLASVTHWQDINVVLSRLLAAQGKDSAAADIIEWEAWEGPRNVLQRLLQAQLAERTDRPDEALRSYQFVADMWRRADPELLPYVAEARAGLARLTGEEVR